MTVTLQRNTDVIEEMCKVVKYFTALWTQIILWQMILFNQHTTFHCVIPPNFKHVSLSLLANIQAIRQINTFYIHIFVHLYMSMHPTPCHTLYNGYNAGTESVNTCFQFQVMRCHFTDYLKMETSIHWFFQYCIHYMNAQPNYNYGLTEVSLNMSSRQDSLQQYRFAPTVTNCIIWLIL
jgi:hypothetical protein